MLPVFNLLKDIPKGKDKIKAIAQNLKELTAFLSIALAIGAINCLFFIPSSLLRIKYCLPAIITLLQFLWMWATREEFLVIGLDAISMFAYLPFLLNGLFGLYFFIRTQTRLLS